MAERKYLYQDHDRHGTARWYFRRRGSPKVRLPHPTSKSFDTAYLAALNGDPLPRKRKASFALVREQGGFVYFVRSGGAIKIGYSRSPLSRVRGLTTGIANPIATVVIVPGSKADERALHTANAAHRLTGEWFKDCPAVARVMAQSAAYGRLCDPPG